MEWAVMGCDEPWLIERIIERKEAISPKCQPRSRDDEMLKKCCTIEAAYN